MKYLVTGSCTYEDRRFEFQLVCNGLSGVYQLGSVLPYVQVARFVPLLQPVRTRYIN